MKKILGRSDRSRLFRAMASRHLKTSLRRGEIDKTQYASAVKALQTNQFAHQVMTKAHAPLGIDAQGIIQWIKDNWFEILKFVLTIMVMFI